MRSLSVGLGAALRPVGLFAFLLVAVSLVPSEEAYYRAETLFHGAGPLGSASQHLRSVPATASSLVFEAFQRRLVEVAGVEIDLDQAVNPTPNVIQVQFLSESLGEDRTFWVYLPPEYEGSDERYPALYLLHGMSQDNAWWTQVGRVDRIATAMIASGRVKPLIIVMPNGNRVERDVSTTSLYDDHCDTGLDAVARVLKSLGDRVRSLRIYKISCEGDFGAYIADEVVEEVDTRYRTSQERYVGGFSVGGRGALQLALGTDGVFDGAFGLSGNYDYVRKGLREGDISSDGDLRLFLAAGDKDQRGVYGGLSTFLFHRDLEMEGIDHLYCTFDGTHSEVAWVSAIPRALEYLVGTGPRAATGQEVLDSCDAADAAGGQVR